MKTDTITGPAYWASYLVNGDASGLEPEEKAMADAWLKREGCSILDVARDDEGEAKESRFTWSYRLYCPEANCDGGSVLDYVCTY